MSDKSTRIVLLGAATLVAMVLGVSLSLLIFGGQAARDSARLSGLSTPGGPTLGGPFELVDQNGRTVDESVLAGRPTLLYFGFTFCPDFCPMELANISRAAALLRAEGQAVQTVFVTIDPTRDTPEVLKEYVENFDAEMLGLGGTEAQVAAAAKAYGVFFQPVRGEDFADGYTMEHTTFVYALDASGSLIKVFRANSAPEEIAEAVRSASAGSSS
ncbi:MAG: SCO family protein [Pseudomonadota bacterium]